MTSETCTAYQEPRAALMEFVGECRDSNLRVEITEWVILCLGERPREKEAISNAIYELSRWLKKNYGRREANASIQAQESETERVVKLGVQLFWSIYGSEEGWDLESPVNTIFERLLEEGLPDRVREAEARAFFSSLQGGAKCAKSSDNPLNLEQQKEIFSLPLLVADRPLPRQIKQAACDTVRGLAKEVEPIAVFEVVQDYLSRSSSKVDIGEQLSALAYALLGTAEQTGGISFRFLEDLIHAVRQTTGG